MAYWIIECLSALFDGHFFGVEFFFMLPDVFHTILMADFIMVYVKKMKEANFAMLGDMIDI